MAAQTETKFIVKAVKHSYKDPSKRFYTEVGRLTLRTGDKGVNGSLYLHMFDTDFAVFPVEKDATEETPQ